MEKKLLTVVGVLILILSGCIAWTACARAKRGITTAGIKIIVGVASEGDGTLSTWDVDGTTQTADYLLPDSGYKLRTDFLSLYPPSKMICYDMDATKNEKGHYDPSDPHAHAISSTLLDINHKGTISALQVVLESTGYDWDFDPYPGDIANQLIDVSTYGMKSTIPYELTEVRGISYSDNGKKIPCKAISIEGCPTMNGCPSTTTPP